MCTHLWQSDIFYTNLDSQLFNLDSQLYNLDSQIYYLDKSVTLQLR